MQRKYAGMTINFSCCKNYKKKGNKVHNREQENEEKKSNRATQTSVRAPNTFKSLTQLS